MRHSQCRIDDIRGPWWLFARAPLLTRGIDLSQPATRVDTTCWQLFRPDINTAQFFCYFLLQKLCQITWLLKKFLYFQRLLLRPEALGICHICHMVNPALDLTPRQILQLTHQWATPDRLIRHWLFSTKNTANDVSCLSSPVISYVLNADSGR